MEERLVTVSKSNEDEQIEASLRPKTLEEYVGQEKNKQNLRVFIESCKKRGQALDHVLLYGPPGLGKTTLSQIIANELGSAFRVTSGPAIERVGDLASIITNIGENDVLFVDEIHRLSRPIEEVMYPVMEDFALDLVIGKGPGARSMRLNLKPFTLIGATTRAGMITSPMRDRFGIILRLDLYSKEELGLIVRRSAKILNIEIDVKASEEVASRSRGTPRIANRLLKRIRDFAIVLGDGTINLQIAKKALDELEIDPLGLDLTDLRYLNAIIEKFGGGPVGLETLCASIGEADITIEDVVEPYLLQLGFIARTPRGRMVTENAYKHLNIPVPQNIKQLSLFDSFNDKK